MEWFCAICSVSLRSSISEFGVSSMLADLAKGHAWLVTMRLRGLLWLEFRAQAYNSTLSFASAPGNAAWEAEPGFIIQRLISEPTGPLDSGSPLTLLRVPLGNICPCQRGRRGRGNSDIHSGRFSYWLEATPKIKCMDYLWVSLFRLFLFPLTQIIGNWLYYLFEKIAETQWMIYVAEWIGMWVFWFCVC